MTTSILVDTLALIAAFAGFMLAFRQDRVRRLARRLQGRDPARPLRPPEADGEDPVHYAMIIAGTMLMAFGIIIFAFSFVYGLLT
jgi:hypothetical protein